MEIFISGIFQTVFIYCMWTSGTLYRQCPSSTSYFNLPPLVFKMWYIFYRNLEVPDEPVYSVKAHKEIVNCIDGVGGVGIGDGAPEIVTGSRDGIVTACLSSSCVSSICWI